MEKGDLKIIKDMQQVVAQMLADDIDENPACAQEFFDCDCCGKSAPLAGSVMYSSNRLCNDCVLIAEISFALKKISSIQEMLDNMEDKRLEEICGYIKIPENGKI